jgi:16S rRNA processing protein RimM
MTNYNSIGKFVAAFGLKGELILRHELGKKTSLKGLLTIFIEDKKDEMLPYFIEQTKIKSETEVYIKLEGLDVREKALKLIQKQVWLPQEEFQKYAAAAAPVSLLGYTIINDGETLGEVLEVIEQPHQLLCRIEWKNKEALIPLHDQTMEKIDKRYMWYYLKGCLIYIVELNTSCNLRGAARGVPAPVLCNRVAKKIIKAATFHLYTISALVQHPGGDARVSVYYGKFLN